MIAPGETGINGRLGYDGKGTDVGRGGGGGGRNFCEDEEKGRKEPSATAFYGK